MPLLVKRGVGVILKRRFQAIVLALVLASTITGCGSTKKIRTFTQALTEYTSALDKLLAASGVVRIESTSEQLLRDDTSNGQQDVQQYEGTRKVVDRRFELLADLRAHIRLLGQYFALLNQLASSDAPERASEAAGNLVSEIQTLDQKLRSNSAFPKARYEVLKAVVKPIFKIAVSSKIRSAIREELKLRKVTIQDQLLIQQALLEAVIDDTKNDLEDLQERRENRIVVKLYVDTIIPQVQQQAWIDQRREILDLRNMIIELEEANAIAEEFRLIFEDFVQGNYNVQRVESVTARMQKVTEVAKKAIE